MNLLLTFFLVAQVVIPPTNGQQTGDLRVEIENLRNSDGIISLLLFENDDGYPENHEKALMSLSISANDDSSRAVFSSVPYGDYAIAVLHDENSNQKMDKSILGTPKEGFGVSNNVKPKMFGPPPFEDCRIKLNKKDMQVKITLQYD